MFQISMFAIIIELLKLFSVNKTTLKHLWCDSHTALPTVGVRATARNANDRNAFARIPVFVPCHRF